MLQLKKRWGGGCLTNFTYESEILDKNKYSVFCFSLWPRQQVPLANGTTNTCSSSKCEVKLELAFEYLMSKDRLQWVTITSQQVRKQGQGVRNTFRISDWTDIWSHFRLSWWASAFSQWWMSWWWRNQAVALKRSLLLLWLVTPFICGAWNMFCHIANYPSLYSCFFLFCR